MGQRVLASAKPWKRTRDHQVLGLLRAAGVPAAVPESWQLPAFDDTEFELRPPAEWLAPLERARLATVAAEEAESVAAAAAVEAAAATAAAEAAPATAPEPEEEPEGDDEEAASAPAPPAETPAEATQRLSEEAARCVEVAEAKRAEADVAQREGKVLAQYLEFGEDRFGAGRFHMPSLC